MLFGPNSYQLSAFKGIHISKGNPKFSCSFCEDQLKRVFFLRFDHIYDIVKRGWVAKYGYVSASQSKGRMFEAHHDPCSLLEGEATLPSPEK